MIINILFRYFCLLLLVVTLTTTLQANTLGVSVKPISLSSEHPDSLLAEGKKLLFDENFIAALQYLQDGYKANDLSADQRADYLYHLSLAYRKLNMYPQAVDLLKELTGMQPKTMHHKQALLLLGAIHKDLGQFDDAFNIFVTILQQFQAEKDTFNIARNYYSLGSLFYYQNNYIQALDYYEKSYDLAKAIQNQKIIYNCLAAFGSTYEAQNKLELSLEYQLQSLAIADKIDYQTGLAYSYHNLGSNYLSRKQYDQALVEFRKSLEIKQQLNDSWGIIGTRIALTDLYIAKKEYKKAIQELEVVEILAKKLQTRPRLLNIYKKYAKVYEALNDFKQSNHYLREQLLLSDSIFNETTSANISAAQTQYEVQSRDAQINLLKIENQVLEKDKRINLLIYMLTALAVVFTTMLAFILRRSLNKERIYSEALAIKNQEIQQQMTALADSNQSLENFAYVASHDLREPLRGIKSFATLLERRYASKLDNSAKEYFHFIRDGVEQMDALLVNLLNFSSLNNSKVSFSDVNIADVLLRTTNALKIELEQKGVQLELDYQAFPNLKGNSALLGQLFQNLIANGAKFTRSEAPIVKINYTKTNNKHQFSVRDNGIGISAKNQQKIFKMFHRLHGRQEFKGTGIGLATCRKIVELHQGEIWVESQEGSGSTFYFTIPASV